MSEELKPCPFCGGVALSIKPNIHTGLLRVQCEACWAVTATSVSSNNRRTAIAAWNRRAFPSMEGENGLTLRQAAGRLLELGSKIDRASSEDEENRLCDVRDKLLSMMRKADAALSPPVKDAP